MAKVVLIDNFDREYIADVLLEENVSEERAVFIADEYNCRMPEDADWYAVVKPDDYVLSSGLA